jgi:site-specific DNA recombinase
MPLCDYGDEVHGWGPCGFAFCGWISTEDWQDPVTSRARQLQQAVLLVAALADPDRAWDAIVVGEYERAFFGSQYVLMAPLFEPDSEHLREPPF